MSSVKSLVFAVTVLAIFASIQACPSSPTRLCDFYVLGSKTSVPKFTLNKIKNDTILSKQIYSYKTNQPVITLSTDGTCSFVSDSAKCANKFYFRGVKSMLYSNRIAARVFQLNELKVYKKKCVRLNIVTGQIKAPKNKIVYLNPSDGNSKYPMNRRCVVFRTA